MEKTNVLFNSFCSGKGCEHYIKWTFDQGMPCESCKLVGQSYDIDEYPDDCPFIDEIKIW